MRRLLNPGFGVVRFLGFHVVRFLGFGVKRFLGYCAESQPARPRSNVENDPARRSQDLSAARLPRKDSSAWSFLLSDGRRNVDVHVFACDESGKNVYGIEYPFGSLTGTGELDSIKVSCVAPEWMFRFKTAYAPTAKDNADVAVLAEHFGFRIPDTHKP